MKKDLIVGNAAGVVKNMADIERMCRSGGTRVTLGSITLKPRTGNLPAPRNTYYYDLRTGASINALGLNNLGVEEYVRLLPEMLARTSDSGKDLVVSVAGFSTAEFVELAGRCADTAVEYIELNLGCPNIHSSEGRKPIFSYFPELVEEVLMGVRNEIGIGASITVGVKLSPLEDEGLLRLVANAITRSGIVGEIVACNTIPDQRIVLADGEDALAFQAVADGPVINTGGLAGEPLRERSLWVVRTLRQMLWPTLRIVHAGGISKGIHMRECVDEAGADGFECATAIIEKGPVVLTDIFEEYSELPELEAETA